MLSGFRYIWCLLLSFVCFAATGQSYNYVHYDIKDGLGASTVYCVIQDRDGFMWFGTEAGLSRFDGTRFRTFTTKDGLPDNEILKMYEDSKGRIWMLPFRNAICYYYRGKFYTQHNDSTLKKLDFNQRPLNIFEDSLGTIWIGERNELHRIYKDGKAEKTNNLNGIELRNMYLLEKDDKNRIWFSVERNGIHTIYSLSNNRTKMYSKNITGVSQNDFYFSNSIRIWGVENSNPSKSHYKIESEKYKNIDSVYFDPETLLITFSFISDSIIGFNTSRGSMLYNVRKKKIEKIFLNDKVISRLFKDTEGSWWVTTLGHGIYRVQGESFRSQKLDDVGDHYSDGSVYSFNIENRRLYAGLADYRFAVISLPKTQLLNLKMVHKRVANSKTIRFIVSGTKYIFITDHVIILLNKNFEIEGSILLYPKDVFQSGDTLYIATTNNVIRFGCQKFSVIDTLWHSRATAVFVNNDSVYIGTLGGLYLLPLGGKAEFLGEKDALLKGRISAITQTKDGNLWVATADNGVIRFSDGRVSGHYTTENGLPGNICRTLFADNTTLWVGTNKGIGMIETSDNSAKITKITKQDGLNADFINKILVHGDTVFVATSEGITYFNKKLLGTFSECKLRLLEAIGTDTILYPRDEYYLPNRNLKVSFVGISYKSAGDIVYRYRLNRDNNNWQETRENTLEFVSLPHGKYDLEIIAENKFGVVSEPLVMKLIIPTPFWKTSTFYFLAAAAGAAVILLIYRKRVDQVRRREKEKTELNKKATEMELKALRAQMNPHFTFNVLNSIQYFIGYNDTESAQRYLAKFAKLIRLTLDNSKNVFIALEDEVKILELYLELEKMRFENKFRYSLSVDQNMQTKDTYLPNMLIQPFVENAIKHGFKENTEKPEVQISLFENGQNITCIISDNGIGRKRAEEISATETERHSSAGISMINDKIDALKYYYNYQLDVEIIDLVSGNNKPAGTKVIIRLPKQNIKS